jgi:peptidyl-prolyl cis-trans isomerase D
MGVMGYLRDRMGKIVAIVIGLSLFAFIASEAIRSGGSFFKDDSNELGTVGGEKIPYDEFNKTLEQNTQQFERQSGQANVSSQITTYLQENTWNTLVNRLLMKKEVEKVGVAVGDDETQAMITGNDPSPQVVQAFTNPQTGQFDRSGLLNALQNIKQLKDGDPQKARWADFVKELIQGKLDEKYFSLVTTGLYVNSLEAKDDYEAKNKLVNFKYTTLDYTSIADNKVTLTDADFSNYYNDHKNEFKNPQELRDIAYVSFNGAPSKEDSSVIKTQVEKLVPALKASTNDSLFVQINSETKAPLIYQRKGKLEPKLDSIMFSASVGTVYGPYLSRGGYSIAKLVDARMSPDSVKARHILLDPAMEGGLPKTLAKADSIKKIIESGKKTFADMATMYSVDKNSAVKGGDLGTFGRGAMIPVFDDAVFNGKKGDYKIVTSQFGVHLINIEDQKGSSKVIKVAIVDKPLTASSKTQSAAYSKAQAFLISLNKDNFDEQAKKQSIQVKPGENLTATASGTPGLDNARDLVRWAFKADKGDLSDQVFTIGDQYVVARLTEIKKKGILPLDVIKKQITPAVMNEVKGKMLADKFASAINGSSSIDQVAQKAGSKVVPVQNIVFANPMIPGGQAEYKVIGSVFGSQVNKISKPVIGMQGVFVFIVDNFINPAPLTNSLRQRQQLSQAIVQRSQGQIFEALKDKNNVKDNRAKFL